MNAENIIPKKKIRRKEKKRKNQFCFSPDFYALVRCIVYNPLS